MTKSQIKSLSLIIREALAQAEVARTAAAVACCLGTVDSAAYRLGDQLPADVLALRAAVENRLDVLLASR